MTEYVHGKRLRTGYTTGATAAAAAGYAMGLILENDNSPDDYQIKLTEGQTAHFRIEDFSCDTKKHTARCGVKKYAGDDPDVTDGLVIYADVRAESTKCGRIEIDGGRGIGVVTKKGLDREVGEAAINTAPRRMIEAAVKAEIKKANANIDKLYVSVVIEAPGGEEIAEHTLNERLGIKGGISILGTSGIVHPMSDRAIVDTIRQETSVLSEQDKSVVYFVPGNYGEAFARDKLKISDDKIIKCSNFIGEAIDIAVEYEFSEIYFIGHFGKLIKLYTGCMNTHSKEADGRLESLAACAILAGADEKDAYDILTSNTTEDALFKIKNRSYFKKAMRIMCDRIEDNLSRRAYHRARLGAVLFSMNIREGEQIVCFTENICDRLWSGQHGGYDPSC